MDFLNSVFIAIYFPLVCAVVMSVLYGVISDKFTKFLSFFGFAVPFVCGLYQMYLFALGEKCVFESVGIWTDFSLNAISMPMFLLAGIVGFVAFLWAIQSKISNLRLYLILMLFTQCGLMGMFSSKSAIFMYAFHEFALIPSFISLIVWGGAGKKIAAMEMAVYLTLGALIALVGIIIIYVFNESSQGILNVSFGLLVIGLGTLVSLFPFHSWAPRTYTALPTSFAMLHAGVLKKFGLYFLLQVCVPLMPNQFNQWWGIVSVLALCNLLLIGFETMAQKDLKSMISYSSVSHMGMCFLGLFSFSVLGFGGTVLLMFGHGLTVALLFMLSNTIMNKTGEWDMNKMGGLYKSAPVLGGFFVAGIFASIGLPGFANFWGEICIFISLWNVSKTICVLSVLGIIVSAIYGLRAIAKVFMGEQKHSITDITWFERLPAIIILFFLLLIGIYPKIFTKALDMQYSTAPESAQSTE